MNTTKRRRRRTRVVPRTKEDAVANLKRLRGQLARWRTRAKRAATAIKKLSAKLARAERRAAFRNLVGWDHHLTKAEVTAMKL